MCICVYMCMCMFCVYVYVCIYVCICMCICVSCSIGSIRLICSSYYIHSVDDSHVGMVSFGMEKKSGFAPLSSHTLALCWSMKSGCLLRLLGKLWALMSKHNLGKIFGLYEKILPGLWKHIFWDGSLYITTCYFSVPSVFARVANRVFDSRN